MFVVNGVLCVQRVCRKNILSPFGGTQSTRESLGKCDHIICHGYKRLDERVKKGMSVRYKKKLGGGLACISQSLKEVLERYEFYYKLELVLFLAYIYICDWRLTFKSL